MNQNYYKLTDKKWIRFLFFLCWIGYFSTYIGRLNYSAGLTEIIRSEGFTKGQAGMIGTGFFFAYGVGQFISGFLGDHLAPGKMVFAGLLVSGLCNLMQSAAHTPLQMTAVWCVNGLFQSFIWSPMIRLLFEYYRIETRMRACVSLNSSVPIGTMAAYGITAAVIWLSGWRSMFVFSGVVLLVVSFVWLAGIRAVNRYAMQYGECETAEAISQRAGREPGEMGAVGNEAGRFDWKYLFFQAGFLLLMLALFVQGALKDGVTTWVPDYISETYGLSTVAAISSTMIIPAFNLAGVFLASYVNVHYLRNEVRTAGTFFGVCGVSLLVLRILSGQSAVVAFLMLAVATTSMMAVNTMLIAVLPSYFGVVGRASTVSGILNSSVYAGGAASTYGIGAVSMLAGWDVTIEIWFLMAILSVVFCILASKPWNRYRFSVLKD